MFWLSICSLRKNYMLLAKMVFITWKEAVDFFLSFVVPFLLSQMSKDKPALVVAVKTWNYYIILIQVLPSSSHSYFFLHCIYSLLLTAGIHPSPFTNVRFLKKIEFLKVTFREKTIRWFFNESGGLEAF